MKKLVSSLIIVLFAVSASAATYTVDANGTGDYPTIQAAVDAAVSGDIIIVADGTYNSGAELRNNIPITIKSENGPNNCVIDCQGSGRAFYILQGSRETPPLIDGFTITNGFQRMEYGGAIFAYMAGVDIANCILVNNRARSGGAIAFVTYSAGTVVNCIIKDNETRFSGGAIYAFSGCKVTVSNCLILSNIALRGSAIESYYGSDVTVANCTILNNNAYLSEWDGALYCRSQSELKVFNSIIWKNVPFQISASNVEDSAIYLANNNIQGGDNGVYNPYNWVEWGPGNISSDPRFVAPGYWDPNGTPTDANDDFWVDGDYHLLLESPCINAGNPNYVPEPNETDLDGNPRIAEGRIDMGCYEFQPNAQPIAIAGPNQIAYAFIDGFSDVTLDGSASYDDDNDVLDYYWSWTIDGNDYEANGVSPTITLPVGEYIIELVIDDGWVLSEPDYCTINVIEPLRAKMFCMPRVLNTSSRSRYITTFITMPEGITPADINDSEPLLFIPGNIEATRQFVWQSRSRRCRRTYIMAVFDKSDCMQNLSPGQNEVNIVGKLTAGQYFYGTDYLRIIPRRPWFWCYRHR